MKHSENNFNLQSKQKRKNKDKFFSIQAIFIAIISLLVIFSTQAADKPKVEKEAIDALKKMSSYMRTLKVFQVSAEVIDEDVLESGQKIQRSRSLKMLAQSPNKLRVETTTNYSDRVFYFNGKTFSILGKLSNYYASTPAPKTIVKLDEKLQSKFGFGVPMIDLFKWKESNWKPGKIKDAFHVGPAVINGVPCGHYAFRQEGVDWQIWIQRGKFPLPQKMVITSLDDEARPQYSAELKWNLAPAYNDAAFQIDPETTAKKIVLAKLDPSKNTAK